MSTIDIAPERAADAVVGPFDEAAFDACGKGEPSLLRAKREQGFHIYENLPGPTSFDEEWRRTNPRLFPFADFRAGEALPRIAPGEPGEHDDAFDVVVNVDIDGYSIDDRSGAAGAGRVMVLPLAEASESCADLIETHLNGEALPSDWDKFVALNDAFWNFGLFIYVPPGVELEKGIHLKYALSGDGNTLVPQVLIVLGEQSKASVLESMRSPDDAACLSIATKEIYLQPAARLTLVTQQEWGRGACQIANDMARVESDAQIDWITLNFGTGVSKLKLGSDVCGSGACAELDGLFFCDGKQHIDQKTLQIHSAPHTYSRLLYKGAVQDEGHSVYQGVIQARPGAVKVDAYQTNNNLVLNSGAKADTIPGLLIDADDLKCSHGATIGNLDPDHVFYMRSRGLSEADARRLLIRGFYDEVADRIPYPWVRDQVHRHVDARLGV
jgi:Fe-S cluster assembly protein SufD